MHRKVAEVKPYALLMSMLDGNELSAYDLTALHHSYPLDM
jgi:hypothetical protein